MHITRLGGASFALASIVVLSACQETGSTASTPTNSTTSSSPISTATKTPTNGPTSTSGGSGGSTGTDTIYATQGEVAFWTPGGSSCRMDSHGVTCTNPAVKRTMPGIEINPCLSIEDSDLTAITLRDGRAGVHCSSDVPVVMEGATAWADGLGLQWRGEGEMRGPVLPVGKTVTLGDTHCAESMPHLKCYATGGYAGFELSQTSVRFIGVQSDQPM